MPWSHPVGEGGFEPPTSCTPAGGRSPRRPGSESRSRKVSFEAEKIAALDRISTTADRRDDVTPTEETTNGGEHPRSLGSHLGLQTSAVPTVNACYQHFRGAPGRTRTCGLPLRRRCQAVHSVRSGPPRCTDSAAQSPECAPIRGGRRSLGPA